MAQIIQRYQATTLLPATFALSITGLGLSPGSGGPSFIPLIALLTTTLVYTKPHNFQRYAAQWVVLTISITASHSKASLNALSTPSMSMIILLLLSSLSAVFALIPVYATHSLSSSSRLPKYRTLIFPTFWTLVWLFVSRGPIGRLLTWTPLTGISAYAWVLPILGLPGLDFICALWASTAAEYVYALSVVDESPKDEPLIPDLMPDAHDTTVISTKHYTRTIPSLTLLLALTLPSFYTNPLPLPPHSDTAHNTPLGVSCILPPPPPAPSTSSPLDRFITESKKYTARSKVMLWPEGAVTFENEAEKNQAVSEILEKVFEEGRQRIWVGVSFLERANGEGEGTRDGQYRNGMMLIGQNGVEFTYYKRHLVPIAESFSQISSSEPPPLHTIQLENSKLVPRLRPIELTTSICLDFSAPLFPAEPLGDDNKAVTQSRRPSLILAPARTWDVQVGEAMYTLARIRAQELGAELLWCDGGSGGLSGVGGDVQVGWGSWSKDIGVPYHGGDDGDGGGSATDSKPTIYAVLGDFGAIIFAVAIWGAVVVVSSRSTVDLAVVASARIRNARATSHEMREWIKGKVVAIKGRIRERITGNRAPVPLLIRIDQEEEERLI